MEFVLFKARLVGKQFTFEENSHGEICLNFLKQNLKIKVFTTLYCILPFLQLKMYSLTFISDHAGYVYSWNVYTHLRKKVLSSCFQTKGHFREKKEFFYLAAAVHNDLKNVLK